MVLPRRKLVLADSQPLQHSYCPWDDELDSRQPYLQSQARALPMQAAPQPSDLPAAQQQLTPPAVASSATCQAQGPLGLATITLEAYQEAFSSLTGGTGSVQPVSMKEKALYTMSDLKQVLAIHGCSTGSKTKQELLDKMQGMQLFDTVLVPPEEVWMEMLMPSGLSCGVSSCITGADLHQLGWATATPALEAALSSRTAFLPMLPKSGCLVAQGPAEGASSPQGPAQLRRSQGCAVAGGPPQGAVAASLKRLASPSQPQIGPDQQHPACQLARSHGDVTMPFAEKASQPLAGTNAACPPGCQAGPAALHTESQGNECPNRRCEQHPEMPQWLPEACSRLSHRLRAAASSSSSLGAYIGQQVAFVLLDDVIADSDGVRDVLQAGLHVGRVRENIGAMHQKDLCEAGCSQDHSFHFVRLAVSSERGPVSRQVQRRSKLLDLRVDLAERLRAASFDELFQLDRSALEDAWLLLEPVQSSGQSTLPQAIKPPQAQEKLAASKSVRRDSAAVDPVERRSDQPTEHKRSPAQKRAEPAAPALSGDKQGSNKKRRRLPATAAAAPTQGAAKLASAPEAAASQGGWQLKRSAHSKKPPAAVKAAQGATPADIAAAQDGPGPTSWRPKQQTGASGSTATAVPTALRPGAVVWTKFGAFLWPAQLLSTKTGSGEGVVQLFGIHTRTSVLLSRLEAFSGQPDNCVRLHSELGKQAIMEALHHHLEM